MPPRLPISSVQNDLFAKVFSDKTILNFPKTDLVFGIRVRTEQGVVSTLRTAAGSTPITTAFLLLSSIVCRCDTFEAQ